MYHVVHGPCPPASFSVIRGTYCEDFHRAKKLTKDLSLHSSRVRAEILYALLLSDDYI